MFKIGIRSKVIYIALLGITLFSLITPVHASTKSSGAQEGITNSEVALKIKTTQVQIPEVLIQCVGSLSACSDLNPGTTVTEVIDFTDDDRRIEFKILCEGWNCTERDIYYSVTMDVEWGNGINSPTFHESATLGTTPGGSGGLVTMPCGTGLSGSCSLSTSGVISADDINPNPDASWHFGITNTGGTRATGEWHHRVLNIIVSFTPIPNCSGATLSPIAQAVLAETGQQNYCLNKFENFTFIEDESTAEAAFQEFAELASQANYEVDFATMIWDRDAGEIFLSGVKELHTKVSSEPTSYPDGIHVRILPGVEHYFDLFDQRDTVLNTLDDLDIPLEDLDGKWRLEVAAYRNSKRDGGFIRPNRHSHVKILVVDGKDAIVGGYNLQDLYLDTKMTDVGVKISGPIVQESLEMFDELWYGARGLTCFSVIFCEYIVLPLAHAPEVLLIQPDTTSPINVFSLYRNERLWCMKV